MMSRLSNTLRLFCQRVSPCAATAVAPAPGVSRASGNRRSEAAERPRPARVGGFGPAASRSPRRIFLQPSRSGVTWTPLRDLAFPAVSPIRSRLAAR